VITRATSFPDLRETKFTRALRASFLAFKNDTLLACRLNKTLKVLSGALHSAPIPFISARCTVTFLSAAIAGVLEIPAKPKQTNPVNKRKALFINAPLALLSGISEFEFPQLLKRDLHLKDKCFRKLKKYNNLVC
jgi:hypothetical protein